MAETITKKITAVNENGFKVEGYENWFNLSTTYQGSPIPGIGAEIEFTYNPWKNPKSGKTVYYVNEIIPVTQVGTPAAPAQTFAAATYEGMQAAAAQPAAAADMAQAASPAPEPPRIEPEPVSPVLGTQAYTSLSIENQVALKSAVKLLIGVYGGTAHEPKDDGELSRLAVNAMVIADEFRDNFLQRQAVADTAMPDDTLVPTPSETLANSASGDPGPQEPHG